MYKADLFFVSKILISYFKTASIHIIFRTHTSVRQSVTHCYQIKQNTWKIGPCSNNNGSEQRFPPRLYFWVDVDYGRRLIFQILGEYHISVPKGLFLYRKNLTSIVFRSMILACLRAPRTDFFEFLQIAYKGLERPIRICEKLVKLKLIAWEYFTLILAYSK